MFDCKISWSLATARSATRIALKFDRHLGSSDAKMSVKFQSDTIIIASNLAASRLCGKTSVRLVNRGPGFSLLSGHMSQLPHPNICTTQVTTSSKYHTLEQPQAKFYAPIHPNPHPHVFLCDKCDHSSRCWTHLGNMKMFNCPVSIFLNCESTRSLKPSL